VAPLPRLRDVFKTHWAQHAVSLLIGVSSSICANYVYTRWIHTNLTTISIPVLTRAHDEQGFQFQLGVSRAAQLAERLGRETMDYARIRPYYLDEQGDFGTLMAQIEGLHPPVVVGPLRSESADKIVPAIADRMRVPMIIGIATATGLRSKGRGRTWWLSPDNARQAAVFAQVYKRLRVGSQFRSSARLYWDASENHPYAEELQRQILEKSAPEDKPEAMPLTSEDDSFARVAAQLGAQTSPQVIFYAGMPTIARGLLDVALRKKTAATWLFSDGCMDDPEIVAKMRIPAM
jgi:hypothetical protein